MKQLLSKRKMRLLGIVFIFCSLASAYSATDNTRNMEEGSPKIHIFIHACTLGHWQQVLERQLSRIKASGLYEACETLSIGVLGKGDMDPFLQRYPKINLLFRDPRVNLYERPTLSSLHNFCIHTPDSLVLYVHTKGITRTGNAPVNDWAKLMEYFNIDRWKSCVAVLTKEQYDVCGVNWEFRPSPHFSGNFWWAKSRYIATLPRYIGRNYSDPEMWLCQNSPSFITLHQSNVDHYKSLYPESMYIEAPDFSE